MTQRPRIGFVGIGIMGAPMVRRLLAKGWQVSVWNLEPERHAQVPGATVLESPAAVRAASDIVIFCVLHGDAVEECKALGETPSEREWRIRAIESHKTAPRNLPTKPLYKAYLY